MAYYDLAWYCNAGDQATTGHYAVAKWAATTAVVAGALRRQLAAPAVGSERVFVCIVAGTTGSTEPAWVLTRGAKSPVDGTATWMECTGIAAVNGDITNTINWTAAKAVGTPSLGTIIQRNNGASYQICTTAGTLGAAEPAFSDTAGVTTTETSATTVWTSLGVVGNWTAKGAAPHARLANVAGTNWYVAGQTIYVGDNHAESQTTAISIGLASSVATFGRIICHNHSGNYPPQSTDLATTATISTTATVIIAFGFNGYVYGLTFIAGVGQSGAASLQISGGAYLTIYDTCNFKLANTASNSIITLNNSGTLAGAMLWNNCQVNFANAGQFIDVGVTNFIWQNTGTVLATGSTVPTNLMGQFNTGTHASNIVLEGLDLSQVTSVIRLESVAQSLGSWIVKDCKLNASVTFPNEPNTGHTIQVIRSDSGATAYKSARYATEGTETTETSITRVGGASDPTGQAQSRKIVTTANSQWLRPFKAEPYAIWNPTAGLNVTVTVCGTVNAGALPNNDDIWIEAEYLGSSSSTLGTIVNTTKTNLLAANAAVASDSSTWNVPAFTAWNPFDLLAMTLSNNNLTATNTASPSGVRAKEGFGSGKYYWEYTVSTWVQTSTAVGFGLASALLNSAGGVGTATVVHTGVIFINNVSSGSTLGTRASGDIIGIALDVSNNLCWFRVAPSGNWNGSGTANPATGVGGVSISTITGTQFPAFWASNTGEVATANFGGSTFSGAVPSGFTSGWPAVWSPFKLTTTLSSPQPGMAGYLEARVRAAKPSTTYYIDPKIVLS